MKNFFPILCIFLLIAGHVYAQPVERMEYNLHYGFIRGGKAILEIKDTVYNGRAAIYLRMEGNTVGLADKLFEVHDTYESIVNPETFLPYKAVRNVKEGKYRYYNEVTFFQAKDSIYSRKTGGEKVPHNMVDILSAFFYLRQHAFLDRLDEGQEFTIPVFHAGKYFMMTATFLGTDKIKSDMGNKRCYVLSPRVSKGKLLKRSDGLEIYITKDKQRIPLLLKFDMRIGSLKADLHSYELNGVEQIK